MSSKYWAKKPGSTRERKILSRGTPNRRCLHTETHNGVETYLHATKGRRVRKEPEVANNVAGDLYASFLA